MPDGGTQVVTEGKRQEQPLFECPTEMFTNGGSTFTVVDAEHVEDLDDRGLKTVLKLDKHARNPCT
jgi:hypothetical protein